MHLTVVNLEYYDPEDNLINEVETWFLTVSFTQNRDELIITN